MKISILINTCDAFEDCWNPFFNLFSKYWSDFEGTIYLNTETKTYAYPGLNIVSLKVSSMKDLGPFDQSWSQCLIDALSLIDDDIILYMQEDYFLKDYVKNDLVMKYLKLLKETQVMGCIHLTDQGTKPDTTLAKTNELYLADVNHRDLLSCQAALWKKETLLKCLKASESGWEFEEFGSKRAKYLNLGIYTVDRSYVRLNEFEILPYIFTGIVQGKWKEEVRPLFEKNEIEMDFSKRGFLVDKKNPTFLEKIKRKIKKMKLHIINYKDIFMIRVFNRKSNELFPKYINN